jgi:hypothetical protein
LRDKRRDSFAEIAGPPAKTPSVRKRAGLEIDGEPLTIGEPLSGNQALDGERMAESKASDASSPPMSAACPEAPSVKSVEPPRPDADPDLIEVNIPTRSGWITKYVPRR